MPSSFLIYLPQIFFASSSEPAYAGFSSVPSIKNSLIRFGIYPLNCKSKIFASISLNFLNLDTLL